MGRQVHSIGPLRGSLLETDNPAPVAGSTLQTEANMANKQIVFSDQEQQQIEAIVIDKDKDEALKFMEKLVQAIKGTESHACTPGPIR